MSSEDRKLSVVTRGSEEDAWALFARAPAVRFAAVEGAGAPVLRTLSAVVVDGAVCFHGGDHGEKLGLLERPVLASCEEIVAQVASYWVDPELACPASTYYRSAIAEGTARRVVDAERKARIVRALMERFQPEGGYLAITPESPRYRKVLEQLLVAELVPTRITAKHKLGQHRTKAQIERVLAGLWRRGAPGDLAAIRAIREAHPERPLPAFLRGPCESVLCVSPDAQDAAQVAAMLEGQYWTEGFTRDLMERAQRDSSAWVVARAPESGEVLGSARAVSDGSRFAWVLDVIVQERLRGQGLGRALMALLLDHPALRHVLAVGLRTRDAQGLYASFGFVEREMLVMERKRALPIGGER